MILAEIRTKSADQQYTINEISITIPHLHNPSLMNTCRLSFFAIVFGMIPAVYSQEMVSAEEDFTASDVLAWERKSQVWYFETSISMAAIVAAQNPTSHAECINDWYFSSDQSREAVHDEIIQVLQKFEEHHPGTVMIAVLERACGSFNFRE